jgi:hypothetical protein
MFRFVLLTTQTITQLLFDMIFPDISVVIPKKLALLGSSFVSVRVNDYFRVMDNLQSLAYLRICECLSSGL